MTAVVCLVALGASALTLFSGFGLGTLLMPAFALVFPAEVAVGATAVVHLANNLFKLALVGRSADRRIALRFGLAGAAAAAVGARLLVSLSDLAPLAAYELGSRRCVVTPIKLAMGALIAGFSWLELSPKLDDLRVDEKWLPAGGALSGFFGGLSGHQGALRAAFLAKSGLSAQAFVGTGVVCAVLVDCVRLAVYGASFWRGHFEVLAQPEQRRLIGLAAACAFAGSFFGARALGKVTMRGLQRFVGWLLLVFGAALAAGLI